MTADDLDGAERLLAAAARGEAGTGDPVADLLAALVSGVDEPHEPSAGDLAAFAEAVVSGAGARSRGPRRLLPLLVVGGSLLLGSAAAAATGSLPDAVQDVAHDIADAVGVDIPEGHDHPSNQGGVDGVGSEGTPPGQGGTVPGTGEDGGGNGVGSDGTPPGQGGTVPGTGDDGGGNGVGSEGTPPSNDGVGPDGTPPANGGQGTPATPTTRTPPTTPTTPTTPTPPTTGGQGGGNPND